MNILTETPLRQPELLEIILSHIPTNQRAKARLVNRTWDTIVTFTPEEYEHIFSRAILCGYVTVVDALIRNNRVDPSRCRNEAICTASAYGHLPVVERLLQDPRVDPCMRSSFGMAIQYVCEEGHFAVLDRLLQDCRVKSSVLVLRGKHNPLYIASELGYFRLVDRLLREPIGLRIVHCAYLVARTRGLERTMKLLFEHLVDENYSLLDELTDFDESESGDETDGDE